MKEIRTTRDQNATLYTKADAQYLLPFCQQSVSFILNKN